LFYDDLHPMSRTHQILAAKFDEFVRGTTLNDLLPSQREMIRESKCKRKEYKRSKINLR